MWTDVLEDVNHLPLCEPVGPRHSVTEDDQAIDFFFHLLIEPQFVDFGWYCRPTCTLSNVKSSYSDVTSVAAFTNMD